MAPKYPLINVHGHMTKHPGEGEERLVRAREDGVVRFCCATIDDSEWSYSSDELAPLFEKYPDFLVGLGYLNMGREVDPPDRVDALKAMGFAGLKAIIPFKAYNDDAYFPLYERAEKLGMPILFHTGWVAGTDPDLVRRFDIDATKYTPYTLDRIARYFPELRIIGAHLGHPHFDDALQLVHAFPNVYFDFSGGGCSAHWVATLKRVLAPFPGADLDDPDQNPAHGYFRKFCFATDNPRASKWYPASEDISDYLHIPEAARQLFYYKNACHIFGWDDLARDLEKP